MTRQGFETAPRPETERQARGHAAQGLPPAQRNAEGQTLAEARTVGRRQRLAANLKERFTTQTAHRIAQVLGVVVLIAGLWLGNQGFMGLRTEGDPLVSGVTLAVGIAYCGVAVWLWNYKKRAEQHARKLRKAIRIDSQADLEEAARNHKVR